MDDIKRSISLYANKDYKPKSTPKKRVGVLDKKEQLTGPFINEKEQIEIIIRQRNQHCHVFSQSLLNPYTPLTIKDKEKVIEDMNESSINRFMEYNNIFDQIKQQINDINNSLYESVNDSFYKKSIRRSNDTKQGRLTKTTNREREKEKDKETSIRMKYISNKMPKLNSDSYKDEEVDDENVNGITIKNTFIQENAKLLISSRLNTNKLDDFINARHSSNMLNRMLFIEARTEYKKRIRIMMNRNASNYTVSNVRYSDKKTFNTKKFYYEPSITSKSNIDKTEIDVITYCNCLIV